MDNTVLSCSVIQTSISGFILSIRVVISSLNIPIIIEIVTNLCFCTTDFRFAYIVVFALDNHADTGNIATVEHIGINKIIYFIMIIT